MPSETALVRRTIMTRKAITVVALGIISTSAALFASGCTSSNTNQPRALTGTTDTSDLRRWTDDKGHPRPEWKNGINTPPGYPKQLAESH
jgi:hypothetical protein